MFCNLLDKETHNSEVQTRFLVDEWEWPSVLAKATVDPYTYHTILRNGDHITFESAHVVNRKWVCLQGLSTDRCSLSINTLMKSFYSKDLDRGVEIRVSDIMCIADSPS